MKTVRKALALLDHFTVAQPEWGLSDLARETAQDKANTLRLLKPLVDAHFLIQDAQSRKYRLGHAVLTYARVREVCFPFTSVLQPVLQSLTAQAAESAHAAVPGSTAMMTVGTVDAMQRATRVVVDPSQPLPFHATASGIAYMAFVDAAWLEKTLKTCSLTEFTSDTPTDLAQVKARIEMTRKQGYFVSNQTLENDVVGVAVPFFDVHGLAQGTLAIAAPASRVNAADFHRFASLLANASRELARALGTQTNADWERVTANLSESTPIA